jgi:hypothetical protein
MRIDRQLIHRLSDAGRDRGLWRARQRGTRHMTRAGAATAGSAAMPEFATMLAALVLDE